MRTPQEQIAEAFNRTVDKARHGASLCGCLMFIHEPTQGEFVTTENSDLMDKPATHTVDHNGILRKYHI